MRRGNALRGMLNNYLGAMIGSVFVTGDERSCKRATTKVAVRQYKGGAYALRGLSPWCGRRLSGCVGLSMLCEGCSERLEKLWGKEALACNV